MMTLRAFLPALIVMMAVSSSCAPAEAQPAPLTCKEFLSMPAADQLLFIKGMEEGIGVAFAIGSVFAKGLDASAASAGEKAAIQKMLVLPRGFLSLAKLKMGAETVSAVIAKCATQQMVGLAFVDAVSGK